MIKTSNNCLNKLFIIFFFSFLGCVNYAPLEANSLIDSLKVKLHDPSIKGTELINTYDQLAYELSYTDPAAGLEYAQKSLQVALANNNKQQIALANSIMGSAYYYLPDLKFSETHFKKALQLEIELDNKKRQAYLYHMLEKIYSGQGDLKKARATLDKSMQLARTYHPRLLGKLYNAYGIIALKKGDNKQAVNYFDSSLVLIRHDGNDKKIAYLLNNVATVNFKQGNYSLAIDQFTESMEIKKKLKDKAGEAASLQNIASIYVRQGVLETAREYLLKALRINKKLNYYQRIPGILTNLGICHKDLGDYPKAKEYYLKALALYKKHNNVKKEGGIYGKLGSLLVNEGQTSAALEYYKKAQIIAEDNADLVTQTELLIKMSRLAIIDKKYTRSIDYAQKAINNLQIYNNKEYVRSAYVQLIDAYKQLGNYSQALIYTEKMIAVRDSIFSRETVDKLAELNTKYQSEKKENEIKILKKNAEIAELLIKKNRQTRYYLITIILLTMLTVLIYIHKYKAQRKTLELVAAARQKFQDMYEKHSASMLLINPQTAIIISANQAAQDWYGYNEIELCNQDIIKLSQESKELILQQLDDLVKYARHSIFLHQERADGSVRQIEVFASPIHADTQVLLYAIVQDITERVRYQTELVELNTNLEARVINEVNIRREQEQKAVLQARLAALGELAAGIAHEVNQPLQSISFTADNMGMELAEAEPQHAYLKTKLARIFEDIDRMQKIIDHIRTFSREQSKAEQGDFSINKAINNSLTMLGTQYNKNNISISTCLADKLAKVHGNIYRFEQVVLNFLTNAKDALEGIPDAQVQIITSQTKTCVRMEIIDNGVGIEADIIEKICLPFFTTKDPGKGTGLGMSISWGIIKDMQGDIKIKSDPGKGTRICVEIPLSS